MGKTTVLNVNQYLKILNSPNLQSLAWPAQFMLKKINTKCKIHVHNHTELRQYKQQHISRSLVWYSSVRQHCNLPSQTSGFYLHWLIYGGPPEGHVQIHVYKYLVI